MKPFIQLISDLSIDNDDKNLHTFDVIKSYSNAIMNNQSIEYNIFS